MKTILVAMVTFHKQLFMKLDSLLLLLSPPVHTLHLPMFHEREAMWKNTTEIVTNVFHFL